MLNIVRKDIANTVEMLKKRIEEHDRSMARAQTDLHEACSKLRSQVDEMEQHIETKLEENYVMEKKRLDLILSEITTRADPDEEDVESLVGHLKKAKSAILVKQSYEIVSRVNFEITRLYDLSVNKELFIDDLVLRKPLPPTVIKVEAGRVHIALVGEEEEKVLSEKGFKETVEYRAAVRRLSGEGSWVKSTLVKDAKGMSFTLPLLVLGEEYQLRIRAKCNGKASEWSDPVKFLTRGFSECCAWKECPDYVSDERHYILSGDDLRVATKDEECGYSTIIGNIAIPVGKDVSWGVKIIRSEDGKGSSIYVGVAPFDINQNVDTNHWEFGWYYDCYKSVLCSGQPHNCWNTPYGPRKEDGSYVKTGDIIGVNMDASSGCLSFVLGGTNLGCAFSAIPRDRPLVPCVLVWCQGDTVELLPN